MQYICSSIAFIIREMCLRLKPIIKCRDFNKKNPYLIYLKYKISEGITHTPPSEFDKGLADETALNIGLNIQALKFPLFFIVLNLKSEIPNIR